MKEKFKAFIAKPKVKWTLFGIFAVVLILGLNIAFGLYSAHEKQQFKDLGITLEARLNLDLWINDNLPFNVCVKTDCKVIQSGGSFIVSDNLNCNITEISKLSNCSGYDGILNYYGNDAECKLPKNDRYSFLADQNFGKHWLALVMCNSTTINYKNID
jgi:hypothetical protein